MGRWFLTVAVVAFTLAGCGKKPPPEDKVTYVTDDDPRMNAAMEKARSTVKTFITVLKSPKPDQSAFAVKTGFTDGGNTEHIWLTPVSFDGSKFTGTVSNRPEKVTTVQMGQKVTVAPDQISDWMYVENRKLVGGETLRVLRATLPPAEQAEFDKGMPFAVE